MSSPGVQKFRRYVLTASVAAITATGAWYGAGLKMRREFHQEEQIVQDYTAAQKIEQLEMTKSKLLQQRYELQEKIDRLATKAKSDASSQQQQQQQQQQGR